LNKNQGCCPWPSFNTCGLEALDQGFLKIWVFKDLFDLGLYEDIEILVMSKSSRNDVMTTPKNAAGPVRDKILKLSNLANDM